MTPPVENLKAHADDDEVIIEGAFDIRLHYKVEISKAVQGVRGFGLAQPSQWGATFHPKDPAIIFPDGSQLLEHSALGLRFSFLQVNTAKAHWTLREAPLSKLPAIMDRISKYEKGEPPLELKLVAEGDLPASGAEEELVREINWQPKDPPSGPYVLEVTAPGNDGEKIGNRILVTFSEHILTIKKATDSTVLRVAQMSDDKPAVNLPVRAYTGEMLELAKTVTDANGLAHFKNAELEPENAPHAVFIIADTPNGPSLQRLDGETLLSAEHDPAPHARSLRSLIVTDRNLYRPGQIVKIHGIARFAKDGALSIPPAGNAEWKIASDNEDTVKSGAAELTKHGGWDAEWQIPQDIHSGVYEISFQLDGLTGATAEINVQEYRVPLFSIGLEPVREAGPTARVKVSSAYFHGAPNAKAKVHWKAEWSQIDVIDGGDENVVRSDDASENSDAAQHDASAEGDAQLDETGAAVLQCDPPFTDGKKRGRCSVMWTVDVTSPEAQTLTGGADAVVQSADAWAGIRAETVQGADKTVRISCSAIDINDKPVEGAKVHVELFHLNTKTVKEKIAPFVVRYRNKRTFESCAVRDAVTPAVLDFNVKETGDYVAVLTGPGGVVASTSTTVTGFEPAELPVESDFTIGVSLPEPARSYKPGEVAPITVKAPFTGTAWVAIEAGEILDTMTVPLDGNAARINLPVKKEYAPNAVVTVYLIRPGGKDSLPKERIGSVQLEVERPDLALSVTPKLSAPSYKPGAPVHGEIEVACEGKPVAGANFVVFAVDDAVLQLGDWKMPDSAGAFYPPRLHCVSTYAGLAHFIEKVDRRSLNQKGYVIGDGGDRPGSLAMVRKEFKTLAYWKTHLLFDANGRIAFDFQAPDNLTSYRVVAIGEQIAGSSGAAPRPLPSRNHCCTSQALPRFVRVGDDVTLRAVARQKVAKSSKITVRCVVEGLDLQDSKPAEATAPQDIPEVFKFKAHVPENSYGVRVRFEASSDTGETDSVEMNLPVRPPSVLRKETIAATVNTAAFEPISIAPKRWIGGRGAFDLSMSTSPWLPKLTGLPTILEYPHGCFEQISSRVLAYAMMTDLLSGLPDLKGREENYKAMVEASMKR